MSTQQNNDPCGCNAVLIKNVDISRYNLSAKEAVFKVIDRQTYDNIRHEVDTGANFPIGDFLFKGHGNYESFKNQDTSEFSLDQQSLSVEESQDRLKSFVSQRAIDAWLGCKKECIAAGTDDNGFFCWPVSSDKESVTVKFHWDPPARVIADGRVTSSYVLNGAAVDSTIPAGQALPVDFEFQNEDEVTMLYRREPGKVFKLGVNVSGYSDALEIPVPILIPPPTMSKVWVSYYGASSERGIKARYGIKNVKRRTKGHYEVYFDRPFRSRNYVPIATAADAYAYIQANQPESVQVLCRNFDGDFVDTQFFLVVYFGHE